MENILFKKAKLATAMALITSTTLLTACGGQEDQSDSVSNSDSRSTTTSTSETGNNAERVNSPTGTVMGTVVDTNGNPVVGATVYAGKQSAITTEGGTYQLSNVPVTGLEITDKGLAFGGQVRLTIVPPTGFLGAIVTVAPTAVIDNGRSDQGTSEETGAGSTNYFIDGFTAVAGHAVLPAIGDLGATITGVLRDNETGAPIANQSINLELKDVNGSAHTGDGDAISYTSVSYPATTDASGQFTIVGAPNDSDLTFIVGGHTVTEVDANDYLNTGVITNDEVEAIHVGNVYARIITNEDNKPPFVTAIGEVATNSARGKLHDDTDKVLTLHFSEPLQTDMVDTNSVRIYDLDANGYITVNAEVASDGRSMTLTASTDFNAGAKLDLYLLKVDFQDQANNQLAEDQQATNVNAIAYDASHVNGNADYLKLQVEVFRELNTDAAIVTNVSQATQDDSPQRLASYFDQASSAFADVDMVQVSNGVQQLNSQDNDDNANGIDSKERLATLVQALDYAGQIDGSSVLLNDDGTPITGNLGLNSNFAVDVARVSFTPSNASAYYYWTERNGQAISAANLVIDISSSPDAQTTQVSPTEGVIVPKAGSTLADFQNTNIAFTLYQAAPGDVVFIQSMDDFGNQGSTTSITLKDNVPATTILQAAYGELDLPSSSTIFGEQYGNGGELANPDAQAVIGSPLLNITAGMLADHSDVTDSTPSLDALYDGNVKDDNNSPYLPTGIYDATAYAAWAANTQRTIAIAFSEDIAFVSATAVPANTATAALSDWEVTNDVTVASDSDIVNVDLVTVDVANIFQLANTDGQNAKVIDFTDVIKDNAGNVSAASANAKVVINDALPPILEKAIYTGDKLELTFNEAVKVNEDDSQAVVVLAGTPIYLHEDTIADHNAQSTAARHVLSIPFTTEDTLGKDLPRRNSDAIFVLGNYDDAGITASSTSKVGGHADLGYANVQDDFGNSWAADAANLITPTFAVIDNLPKFDSGVTGAFTTGALGTTLTYAFSHPVNLDSNVYGSQLIAGQVEALMDFTNNTIASTTTGSISADRKTITINLVATAPFTTGQSLDFTNNFASLWDSSATAIEDVDAVEL